MPYLYLFLILAGVVLLHKRNQRAREQKSQAMAGPGSVAQTPVSRPVFASDIHDLSNVGTYMLGPAFFVAAKREAEAEYAARTAEAYKQHIASTVISPFPLPQFAPSLPSLQPLEPAPAAAAGKLS